MYKIAIDQSIIESDKITKDEFNDPNYTKLTLQGDIITIKTIKGIECRVPRQWITEFKIQTEYTNLLDFVNSKIDDDTVKIKNMSYKDLVNGKF